MLWFVIGTISSSHKVYQSANCDSRRSFGSVGLSIVAPGSTGNIEMGPRYAISKFFEECRRRNCPGFAPADILYVGNVRLNLFGIFLVEWQLPEFFANLSPGNNNFIDQFLIGPQHCNVYVT